MKTPLLLAFLACALPAAAATGPSNDDIHAVPTGDLRFRTGAPPSGGSVEGRPIGLPVIRAQETSGWVEDAPAVEHLADRLRPRYRIQRRNSSYDGALEYLVITPPELNLPDNARSYRGVTNMRAVGHHLVYEAGDAAAYQDLTVTSNQPGPSGRAQPDFATVMQVAKKGTPDAELYAVAGPAGASDLRWIDAGDTEILRDALKRYLGFTDAQVARTVQHLGTFLGGSGQYVINMARRGSILATKRNGDRTYIYPGNDLPQP